MTVGVEQPCSCCKEHDAWAIAAARSPRELPSVSTCSRCGTEARIHVQGISPTGGVQSCLACGHPELYRQKDFSKALGVSLVVIAAVAAPFTPYYASLFVAAIIDAALYFALPERLVCYVCGARHRGFDGRPRHPRFDREIDERLKYGERAVMGKPMRAGGTANAAEPEH